MDPQAPIEIPKVEDPERAERVERDNHWISILAMAIFVIFSLGVVAFLYYQNQQLKNMLAGYQPTPTPTPTASTSPTPNPEIPTVSSPSANMKVVSPLKVIGTVPAGWMFEGVFPIKLVDSNNKLIAQSQAKEKISGSWQTGNSVDFMATITFTTAKGLGKLILQNDNPSGDPSKSQTFEIPVNLNCSPRPACLDSTPRCLIPETSDMCPPSATPASKACTQDVKLCPNGSYVGRTGPNCEFAQCP